MPVNGIELKEGQIWLDASGRKRTLSRDNKHPRFPWTGKLLENDEWNTYDNDGLYYGDTPSMIDLATLVSEKEQPMKFNPKPGDKIICNNGDELICCDAAFLAKDGFDVSTDSNLIYGYQLSKHGLYQYGWTFWNEFGVHADEGWCIREVVPVKSNEVVKGEEPRYTVEEVTEAFENALNYYYLGGRLEGINKIKDYLSKKNNAEYQEYLRLKAIYE